MSERIKFTYQFPRFFEAVSSREIPENITRIFTNLVRELEKLQRELSRICNINFGDPNWTEVGTFTNSWVNFGGTTYDTAAYMKIDQDVVLLKGLIKSGTISNAAFTLPVGYRPAFDKLIATVSGGAFAQLIVKADGTVVPNAGSTASFSLEGVTFRADA